MFPISKNGIKLSKISVWDLHGVCFFSSKAMSSFELFYGLDFRD